MGEDVERLVRRQGQIADWVNKWAPVVKKVVVKLNEHTATIKRLEVEVAELKSAPKNVPIENVEEVNVGE